MSEYIDILSDYNVMYDSFIKCKRSVSWKPSVKRYDVFTPELLLKMQDKVLNGTWKNSKPREIDILYPKKRKGYSIPFGDRVYQRGISDLVLYPKARKKLIDSNFACQEGKGQAYALNTIKRYIHSYVARYGVEGYILQIDIHKYYQSMSHELIKNNFQELIQDDNFYKYVEDVLNTQENEHGYFPGSQMIQIAGIYMLNKLDHYIKERLHEKYYGRYMDDFLIINHNYDVLREHLALIKSKLYEMGFTLNPDKTHIIKITQPFYFLGFHFRVLSQGKIIMTVKSSAVKHERRKLKRAVNKCKQGLMSKSKVDEMFYDWKAYYNKFGNCYKMLQRMDKYYKDLWKE